MKFDAGFRFVYVRAYLKMARKRFTIARKPCFNVHISNSCSLVSKQYACLVFSNHRLVSYHGRMCKISKYWFTLSRKNTKRCSFFFFFRFLIGGGSKIQRWQPSGRRKKKLNPWSGGHFYTFKEILKVSNVLL